MSTSERMSTSKRSLVLGIAALLGVAIAALCAFMSLAVSAQEPDPRECKVGDDPKKFGCLYKSLGDRKYEVREAAHKELLGRAGRLGGLKADEVEALQRASVDRTYEPDVEIRRRAGFVFNKFAGRFPSVATLIFHLRVQINLTTGDFTLGQATGRYDPKIKADKDKVMELQKHWRALQDALAAGNAANAITAYDNLYDVLKPLGRAELERLKLRLGGKDFTREDLAQILVDDVEQALRKLEDELRNAGANPAPPPKDKAPVDMSGPVDLGLTVGLVAATIVSPGSLDFSLEDAQDPLSLPPPGWQFVGEAFHLEADEELRIAGPILISIVFGEELLVGDPIIDPEMLKVVRIADGEASFLEIVSIDLENSVLYARYEVDAEDPPDADQFGQFAIAYPVPVEEENTALRGGEPATAAFDPAADLDDDGSVDEADLNLVGSPVVITVDLNGDSRIDQLDRDLIMAQLGRCNDPDLNPAADLNRDGCVDGIDLDLGVRASAPAAEGDGAPGSADAGGGAERMETDEESENGDENSLAETEEEKNVSDKEVEGLISKLGSGSLQVSKPKDAEEKLTNYLKNIKLTEAQITKLEMEEKKRGSTRSQL